MNYKLCTAACSAVVLGLSLTACEPAFEGSGSKDAASAEQLALHIDDPWAKPVHVDGQKMVGEPLVNGIYSGSAPAMAGMVTTTILVQNNHISCLEITQDGETQSVGGFEAIRDGKYAQLIEAAQSSDIDVISGATITTAAISQAVEEALEKARTGQDALSIAQKSSSSATASPLVGQNATFSPSDSPIKFPVPGSDPSKEA